MFKLLLVITVRTVLALMLKLLLGVTCTNA